ncbi:hypothetical protein AAF712_003473 [Marasmius tenuissimus]|uniref:Small nuclear ribonucleoprotein Prp3 C-terminal domain-containing protein n=1 Tax=Marasmius tenuissimus TaxID=585030 RepID=A0ABR3AA84_9AGAR
MSLHRQLEELQLISCSLLPGEQFAFSEHCESWAKSLEIYAETPEQVDLRSTLPTACFQVSLHDWKSVWFEVELPREYPENEARPIVTVRLQGETLSRADQERWKETVEEKLEEVLAEHRDSGYPVYELLSSHLIPLLHENAEKPTESPLENHGLAHSSTSTKYHALFTSHHLISPTKRRNLQQWSSSLSLSGFAKVGYPGVIYAQGMKDDVEEFAENVKAMQWLALKLRFLEPVQEEETGGEASGQRWAEFQKVGEVMDEMRRIGREKYVVEMGIGSAGSTR